MFIVFLHAIFTLQAVNNRLTTVLVNMIFLDFGSKSHPTHLWFSVFYSNIDLTHIMKRSYELKTISETSHGDKDTIKPIFKRNSVCLDTVCLFDSYRHLFEKSTWGLVPHMKLSAFLAPDNLPFPEGHLVNAHLSFHGLLTSF